VYAEQLEAITGSVFWPSNTWRFLTAWTAYARVELKLSVYEGWLGLRRALGMKPMEVEATAWQ
jgi:aarF domain-containing kinase